MCSKAKISLKGKKLFSKSVNLDPIATCLLAICCVVWANTGPISSGSLAYASPSAQANQPERINLLIYNQGMLNHVRIQLDYVLEDGQRQVQHSEMLATVVSDMKRHANRSQYWEVLNRSATEELLQKYPEIQYLSLSLEVSPRPTIPYTCISTVTQWRDRKLQESWSFTVPDIPWGFEEVDLQVSYRYREDKTYLDFLEVRDRLVAYMSSLDGHNLSVEQLQIALVHQLSQDYLDHLSAIAVVISN